ncbi:MAG: bifunctional N-acetylglucosamine-1-phosphate uridyltransferase/glucosamine-1-phosphate acetyltransferase [Thermotogae bacterium]|nr:bifunctional N-acetylglucosamine-1-phosphate uridyltransferase/glucosamine-1-phosphate acetyltransferase [Thermotogota bacterium]
MANSLYAVVLAGGQSKRIKSKLPKVFHRVSGRMMIEWVIESTLALEPERIILVGNTTNHTLLRQVAKGYGNVDVIVQKVPRGTGDAVRYARELIPEDALVYVGSGDAPLIRGSTLKAMYERMLSHDADAVILTAEVPDPSGYGRIVREGDRFVRIVEDRDATDEERRIREVNAGFYMFRARPLFEALERISPDNAQGEYYLTDVFNHMDKVVVHRTDDYEEILGVNTRRQLAEVERIMQQRIKGRWMDEGITFILPETIYVEYAVEIGRDTVIYPNVALLGRTRIGEGCVIGPNRVLKDEVVPEGTVLL